MATRKRNPLFGGIMALLLIGFGSYRFYIHFSGIEEIPTWRLIFAGAFIVYGLYVAYTIIAQDTDSTEPHE